MGAQERELRRQLDWLMTFRVVIITTLMVSPFVIELMYRPLLSLQPFYVLRGVLTPYPAGSEEGGTATVRILYSLVAHLVSFIAVAYLASYLTENLRRTGRELEMRRDDLAQLRDYNDNIIESMNSGLLTTDPEGAITFANRGAAEITGRPITDLTRRNILEVLGRSSDFLSRVRAALESERRFRSELDYEDGRGRRLFLGFTVSVLRDRSGDPLGMIFIFQDLTEIRALEDEVALKKRMVALGEMAAGVAHELRNPLASISGSVQVLKRDLKPQGEAAELMDIVIKESKRLDQIIRDFLLFAKPGRFHPESADLAKVLRETLSLLENSEELRPHHRVETRFRPETIRVDLDVNRMKQVFWNLAKNALRAMPEGGTLTVSAFGPGDGQVTVTFADTGIGMSEEDIASNFQPFHGSFASGTGLGLAIVYRIIEEHGGRIRVKSRRGKGTEIAVHLPRQADVRTVHEERRWTAS